MPKDIENKKINHPCFNNIINWLNKDPNFEVKDIEERDGSGRISLTSFTDFGMAIFLYSEDLERLDIMSNPIFSPEDIKVLKWLREDFDDFSIEVGLDLTRIGIFYLTNIDDDGNLIGMTLTCPVFFNELTRERFMTGIYTMTRGCEIFNLHFEKFINRHTSHHQK